ncbi:MAG: hypothetical protein UU10_C0019G0008 [Parcubacteria group bacterium GW2011_GWF1_40_6]|uniref:VOC domain-containing protein n=2 Tax=Candidatus Nomuraibacteriota TaxID=1752729 RepID=A0A0G0QSC6_9BACT|nr:MAG: hypothetical protein UT78_C0005G0053 [Candidatus Nomurabacteria bacterium GW2011_GWF2_40_12]KKR68735.1 MAG: hypothetical protein UU10_C0019G0008 [Parcubacteria group bacterium GW2011_GWF1_40_6]OGJ09044.1 MAG: hypothetical protein A2356_01515 [Candidatus Nomurabacteria bacterium RIFOXYB1_FULL_39_16]OGJ15521.1 MAG: hypothetical protein A2585_01535 [Candidatus Nomurabacteria bacterium RIFOXYD1_FULL_39_12]
MTTIKHIEFWVSKLAVSLNFYENLFQVIDWQKINENGFSNGETKIYFIEQPFGFIKSAGPRHICFLAESRSVVDKVAEFLISNNGNIIRGPVDYIYKNKTAYTVDFKDPDGYILEVATKSQ